MSSISSILIHIIILTFIKGIFHEKLKFSSAVPILKRENLMKLSNLRPINLLSVFSEVVKKIILKRLLHFLNTYNFFNKRQYGFTREKSMEDALLSFTESI